jgi:cyclopropane fatty-acyl-phospholipid synthase-like methyltransferase
MRIATSQDYPEMLERVKKGQKLLDLGCAFGQELRQLVSSLSCSSNAAVPTVCPN